MSSIEAIVEAYRRRNAKQKQQQPKVSTAMQAVPVNMVAPPLDDPDETDADSANSDQEMEELINGDQRRRAKADLKQMYDNMAAEKLKTAATHDLIEHIDVFKPVAEDVRSMKHFVLHMSTAARNSFGQWGFIASLLSNKDNVDASTQFPLQIVHGSYYSNEFHERFPLSHEIEEVLKYYKILVMPPDPLNQPLAAQPTTFDENPADNNEEEEEENYDDVNRALALLAPESTTPYAHLMQEVMFYLENAHSLTDANVAALDESLSDGRHSVFSHSPDKKFFQTEEGGAASGFPQACLLYYNRETDSASVSEAVDTADIMAAHRHLLLLAVKTHLSAQDSPGALLDASDKRDPTKDVRSKKTFELCYEVHVFLMTNQLLGHSSDVKERGEMFEVALEKATRKASALPLRGILEKLDKLKNLSKRLADSLSVDVYEDESPFINLLLCVCAFTVQCLFKRAASGLPVYDISKTVLTATPFPSPDFSTLATDDDDNDDNDDNNGANPNESESEASEILDVAMSYDSDATNDSDKTIEDE